MKFIVFIVRVTHAYKVVPPSVINEGKILCSSHKVRADVSIARPTRDDALVVLADHSWVSGKCGILHILDTSDPAAISEISSFALPQSGGNCGTIATGVAIRGNLVYSTWLKAGVRAIDISDPANPVEVGSYVDAGIFPTSLC